MQTSPKDLAFCLFRCTFAGDMMQEKIHSLYELNTCVQDAILQQMGQTYWVEAELSEVRESRGHGYLELIQSDSVTRQPLAKASARCWRSTWQQLRPYFERVTGQPLHAGIKVLLAVQPQFHELYGFSWIISDINPEYTLGDMALRRQLIIGQLKAEGVFDLQKELALPYFAQRIAVISSATAAGYGDFCNQLADNPYGFQFHIELFPAVMQGEQVEPTVIAALDRINSRLDDFDLVVIIRGGGATADLSGFDTLALAENVANFPIPIITGIGHDRDESILDMVSHVRVKTPTAVATFLIDHLKQVADRIASVEQSLQRYIGTRLHVQRLRLERLSQLIPHLPTQRMATGRHRLETLDGSLRVALQRIIEKRDYQLNAFTTQLRSYDPQRLLQRGYSITLHNGKPVRDSGLLQPGDQLETRVGKGTVWSNVIVPPVRESSNPSKNKKKCKET